MLARQELGLSEAERSAQVDAVLRDPERDPRIPQNSRLAAAAYDVLVTSRAGVLCLSEVHDSILMWSHYADCHAGVCLVYDTTGSFFAQAQPVRYQRTRPSVNPVVHTTDEMLHNAIFTKSEEWAYEKEWRILHYQQGKGERQAPTSSLKAIILGINVSGSDRQLVQAWANASAAKPRVFRAFLSDTEFAVSVPGLGDA
jgi:hypothetical protein